jgi:hypothetical protein
VDIEQEAVGDAPTFSPPASPPIIPPDDFFLNEQGFEGKVRMDNEVGQAHEFEEKLFDSAAFGRFAAADLVVFGRYATHPPFLGDGVDDADGVVGEETAEFAFEGGEVAGLDFDEQVAVNDVDEIAIEFDLELVAWAGQPFFEGGVEGGFLEGADLGWVL